MNRTTRRRSALVCALTGTALALSAGTASAQTAPNAEVAEPATFTSMFTATATPDLVVNSDGEPAPGEPGASGTFNFRINSDEEIICYDITLRGVTPPYQSPARTATHIHEAAAGEAGPPRLAFPNPEDDGTGALRSEGCLQGPFTTGVAPDGTDTGEGFTLGRIEANPAAFFSDTHTEQFAAGAVRGQLTAMPMGGVETGAGATAEGSPLVAGIAATGAAALLGAGVVQVARRRRAQG